MEKYELLKMGKEWPCFMTKSKKKLIIKHIIQKQQMFKDNSNSSTAQIQSQWLTIFSQNRH